MMFELVFNHLIIKKHSGVKHVIIQNDLHVPWVIILLSISMRVHVLILVHDVLVKMMSFLSAIHKINGMLQD